jgi:phage tail-like protein
LINIPVTQQSSIAHLATDPLRNFKFLVTFLPNSGAAAIPMGFMSVSGLNMTVDVIAYREGGYNCVPLDTPVLTTTGWKNMEDIQVGDEVIDPDGNPSTVTGAYPKGERPVYRVTLADGRNVLADAEHLWETETVNHRTRKTLTTLQLKDAIKAGKGVRLIGMKPAEFAPSESLPLDPYLLGVLLSEGQLNGEVSFAQSADNTEMIERCRAALPERHHLVSLESHPGSWRHRIVSDHPKPGSNEVKNIIKGLGLNGHRAWEKFIPEVYKWASIEDRLDLLRGILDGDGSCLLRNDEGKPQGTRTKIQYVSTSKQLRDDVADLIRSLGGQCTTNVRTNVMFTSPNQLTPKEGRIAYTIPSVQMELNPFYMSAKASVFKSQNGAYQRKVVSVELEGEEDVKCISVSAESQCYVLKSYIPTHNTTTQKMPGQADFSPITLSRGVALIPNGSFDYDWMSQLFTVLQGTGTAADGNDFRWSVMIQILDHPVTTASVAVKAEFMVANAWPTSIAFSDLDAGANQLFISQLVLAHEGFEFSLASSIGTNDAPSIANIVSG